MNWATFSKLFMEKSIPQTFMDRRRDEFLSLEQERMFFLLLMRPSFVHYPGIPLNFASVHKRGFVAL